MREIGATVIVVAHRPSAINAVDQLLFLKNGQQVAFGPKEEIQKQVLRAVPAASPTPQPAQAEKVTGA